MPKEEAVVADEILMSGRRNMGSLRWAPPCIVVHPEILKVVTKEELSAAADEYTRKTGVRVVVDEYMPTDQILKVGLPKRKGDRFAD